MPFVYCVTDLNTGVGAVTRDLYNIWKNEKIKITLVEVRCPDALPGGTLKSIALQTNTVTTYYFITHGQGDVANLTEEAIIPWNGALVIDGAKGDTIQINILGSSANPYMIDIYVEYELLTGPAALIEL